MKDSKRTNIGIMLMLTMITVVTLYSMMPGKKGMLSLEGDMRDRSLAEWGEERATQDEAPSQTEKGLRFVIDDEEVERFIHIYAKDIVGKEPRQNMTSFDKREVQIMLEDMGYENTQKLKQTLAQVIGAGAAQEIRRILNENLFDRQMKILNRIIGIE